MERMEGLYQTTLAETQELLDPTQLDHAAKLIANARQVDIYTARTTSIQRECSAIACSPPVKARRATTVSRPRCERRSPRWCSGHAAIVISYSGLAPNLKGILPILSSRHVPVIVIGTPYCARIHPGFAAYLTVSDHESMTHRITQFASHIAVQYVLDSLYSSYFAKDYARCAEFLERSFPYTRLPGLK